MKHRDKPHTETKPATEPLPKPKTLAQAQADFTSEGSPPPGVVGAGTLPVTPAEAEPTSVRIDKK